MSPASSDARTARPRIPLTVIGGFLGAGKTTAVNAILAGAVNRRIAVLVNDFGDLAIDAALIAQRNATTISLTNGCVCCSLVGGLAQALIDVLQIEPALDHIVVEASGVSDPGRIAQIARADPGFLPDATIVIVAADQWPALYRDRYVGDTVAAQVAAADFLVLNKVDLVSAAEAQSLRAQLSALAPRARLLDAIDARLRYEVLLGHAMDNALGPADAPAAAAFITSPVGPDAHARQFATRIFRSEEPVSAGLLRHALDNLPAAVLRAKGLVCLDEAPQSRQLIQVVGSRWSISAFTTRDGDQGSGLVVVGPAEALAHADLSALATTFGTTRPTLVFKPTSGQDSVRRGR